MDAVNEWVEFDLIGEVARDLGSSLEMEPAIVDGGCSRAMDEGERQVLLAPFPVYHVDTAGNDKDSVCGPLEAHSGMNLVVGKELQEAESVFQGSHCGWVGLVSDSLAKGVDIS